MPRPDIEAIRAWYKDFSPWSPKDPDSFTSANWTVLSVLSKVRTLLAYVEELEQERDQLKEASDHFLRQLHSIHSARGTLNPDRLKHAGPHRSPNVDYGRPGPDHD
jgi:hypothetical protein